MCERSWTLPSWVQRLFDRADRRLLLKVAPGARAHLVTLSQALSEKFGAVVPDVIARDPDRGLLLMRDHGGQPLSRFTSVTKRIKTLECYAEIQRQAASDPALLVLLLRLDIPEVYDRFLAFLQDSGEWPAERVGAGFCFGAETSGVLARLFTTLEPLLASLLAEAAVLPDTINHCDLRGENIAEPAGRQPSQL